MPDVPVAIDAHCHLDFPELERDLDEVIARARRAGVQGWVIAAANPDHWDRAASVAARGTAALCLGIHPWWVRERGEQQLQDDLGFLETIGALDGIGETGLDWARDRPDSDAGARQRASYAAHIELAHLRNLPVVLHVVRAHADALGMLSALDLPSRGGLVHAWSAGPEWVDPALELGLHLSFGTDLARSQRVREAAAEVPLDRLLIETDAPDRPLPPHTRGEPAHVLDVATLLAEVRGCDPAEILTATTENARSLFPALRPDPPVGDVLPPG